LEDLWGFNDEALVRAAAGSFIPIISAVGHETDWTLIDLAADWRAPTPTAAAEKAVPVKADLEATLADLSARLRGAMRRLGERRRTALAASARGLKTPDTLLAMPRRQFDEVSGLFERSYKLRLERARTRFERAASRQTPAVLERRLARSRDGLRPWSDRHANSLVATMRTTRQKLTMPSQRLRVDLVLRPMERQKDRYARASALLPQRLQDGLDRAQMRFNRSDRLLNSLGHKGVLARGYAILKDDSGKLVRSASQLPAGTVFHADLADGTVEAVVKGEGDMASSGTKSKPANKSAANAAGKSAKVDQGSLF